MDVRGKMMNHAYVQLKLIYAVVDARECYGQASSRQRVL